MSLRNQLERDGSWLFRHRSFLPLVTVPAFLACLPSFQYLNASHEANEAWEIFCLAVSLIGLTIRVLTVGYAPSDTSGRNTHGQVAGSLSTTGVYSVVRHPLYLGNYLIWLGMLLWPRVWWLAALLTCLFVLYYERIILAEEAFLRERFGEAFESWAAVTPSFIPRFSGWKPSPYGFSWRTVLQREYNAFLLIAGVFFAYDSIGGSIAEHHWRLSYGWLAFLVAGFVSFGILRTLKKRTHLLEAEGR